MSDSDHDNFFVVFEELPGTWFAFRVPNSLIFFNLVWIDVEIRSLVDTLINDSTTVILSQQTIDRS